MAKPPSGGFFVSCYFDAMEQEIATWLRQEQTASSIRAMAETQLQDADAVDPLLPWVSPPDTQFNALWLLKTVVSKSGSPLQAEQTKRLMQQAQDITEAQSLLLLMQCASFITLSEETLPIWEKLVQQSRTSGNKFTQAHSYNGLIPMVALLPALKTEALLILDEGYNHGSKAVQARIRNVKKALESL